jgi:hypothetical protein
MIGVTVDAGFRQLEDIRAARREVNKVFRSFIQLRQGIGTLPGMLATLNPLHRLRAFARDYLVYDCIFRIARNFATCFMASEKVIEEGSASTAILTRPRTPANKFWLFGFGRHFG